ncbi:transcription termination factor MTERF8, chloroplastic-like [Magnolia sinica]|uniref:transcription termination factor MTERF8, chloroplastic-like n=1 Tax=Magnolia sinica TaxID=86752 RepID=UPI002658BE88|nr:transcription termination factor MTERF8, chloroplastic-like [Magnolia sinica]
MFPFIHIRRKLHRITTTTKYSTPHSLFLLLQQNPSSLKPFSNISTKTQTLPSSFTLSYLINSCGLSPQSALSASQKIQLKSPQKPDSVLSFFRNHGFTKNHIANLITKRPQVLLANADKTLMPKIQFFHGLGIPGPILARIISSDPTILTCRSLKNHIIPYIDFIKTYVHANEDVITSIHRSTRSLHCNFQKVMESNIRILWEHGVPESKISRLITLQPAALLKTAEQFNEIVAMVKEMGFDPSSGNFILAIRVISMMSRSNWEEKVNVYRSLGWSEDEFLSAFKVQPNCMMTSAKKIKSVMSFFTNEMDWKPSDLSRYPCILLLSLEKTIIPRCSVLRILMSKGLIEKQSSVHKALIISEKAFSERFMVKYQESIPEILTMYQGKMGFVGLCIKLEDVGGTLKL